MESDSSYVGISLDKSTHIVDLEEVSDCLCPHQA